MTQVDSERWQVVAHVLGAWLAEPALDDVMPQIMEAGDAAWLVNVALASLRTLPVDQRMELMGMAPAPGKANVTTVENGQVVDHYVRAWIVRECRD